jgi:hypothetical protein
MQITVQEAADALNVSYWTIGRWYNETHDAYAPKRAVLDTEELCRCIGMDHKTLIAFLTGYDMALTRDEVAEIMGFSVHNVRFIKVRPFISSNRVARWSFRAIAREVARRMEENNDAPKLAPGCHIMPPAQDIPGFDSIA